MALAQPTPIAGTTPQLVYKDGLPGILEETILTVPGPVGSFAVVTIYIPNTSASAYADPIFKVGGRLISSGSGGENTIYGLSLTTGSFKIEGVVVPGGESITVEYRNTANLSSVDSGRFNYYTATGLFYKAS